MFCEARRIARTPPVSRREAQGGGGVSDLEILSLDGYSQSRSGYIELERDGVEREGKKEFCSKAERVRKGESVGLHIVVGFEEGLRGSEYPL